MQSLLLKNARFARSPTAVSFFFDDGSAGEHARITVGKDGMNITKRPIETRRRIFRSLSLSIYHT